MLSILFLTAGAHLMERGFQRPAEWSPIQRAAATSELKLTFAVKQSNLGLLQATLLSVSDPDSANYGKHLTLAEVNELTRPSDKAVQEVLSFINSFTKSPVSMTGNADFITTVADVATIEAMFNTELFVYTHPDTKMTVIRAENYSVPNKVAPYLDFVSPFTRFPPVNQPPLQVATELGVTPSSLRSLYNVGTTEGSAKGNLQAVTAFLEQYYSPKDLEKFYELEYPVAKGRTISKVIGPNKENSPKVEASLDVQYMTALGGNIATEFWSFAGRAPDEPDNEPFLDFLLTVANTSDAQVPKVFSTSYGEEEKTTSLDYANRMNAEFQKAGARGISILFASGDSGVGGKGCPRFPGQWPAGSPWVTAVGGTTGTPETGAGLSSGGFSDRWEQPDYQKDAVNTFLRTSKDLPDPSHYNISGRAFPDISAQATGFTVINGGFTLPGVAGTSCSCPTFSGIVALLNDLRISNGKPTLGFLNPFIYKNPTIFNDIKSGNNPGCSTRGFTAIAGWDPVTGYGTPNYQLMAKAVLALP